MRKLTFIILCLEGVILSFNVAANAALVPSIAGEFAISQFVVGRIVWLYMLPYGVAALFYGPLVRTFDAKNVELICLSLFSLANLIVGLANNIYSFFVGRFLMGMFGASVIPLALILIAKQSPDSNRGKLVGIFFSATFVASLLGLFLSGTIPWRLIFIIPAALGFVLCVCIYFCLPNFKEDLKSFRINYFGVLKSRTILSLFTYIFLISLFYHSIQQWLGVYFSQKYEFSQFLISMLITLTSLSGIFGEAFGGFLSDKVGRIKTVNLGIILMIVSVFLLIFITFCKTNGTQIIANLTQITADENFNLRPSVCNLRVSALGNSFNKISLFILVFIMIIWGLGWTFNHAGVSTLLTDLPKEFLNESASLNSSVRFISGGLGAVLGGLLLQRNVYLYFVVFGGGLVLLTIFSRNLLAVE